MPAMRLVVPGSAGRSLRTATHRTRRRGELVRVPYLMAARRAVTGDPEFHDSPAEHSREGREVDDVLSRVLPGLSGTGPVARSGGLSGIALHAVPGMFRLGGGTRAQLACPKSRRAGESHR